MNLAAEIRPRDLTFRSAILVMGMALAATGCQQRTSAPAQHEATSQSPRQILEQLAATYRAAQTYQDAGELHIVPEGAAETNPQPFAVALERPARTRVHSLGAIIVCDGENFRAVAPSLDEQLLVRPCAGALSLGDFTSDEILQQAMRGQLDAALPQLTLLLDPKGLENLTAECTLEQLPDAEYQGETCHRIAARGPDGTAVFWISPQTHLLRKYEFPLTAIREHFPLASVWVDFKGARCDHPIGSPAFQMEVPAEARLVKRFILPAPEAPTPLLGKPAGEFVFTDLSGQPVSRESLAGKVVVLDMWATWCGWCFEGLPLLEQVYTRYKDNELVVILAVCQDETTVSDARVRASFDAHKLTLPIVRDSRKNADELFGVRALPTSVILGVDGTVQDFHVGYDAQLTETLPEKIEKLLAGENLAQNELDAYREQVREYEARLAEVLVDNSAGSAAEVARKPGDTQ
jgi:thiol-disulfide isomerase/thioredoxin